MIEFAKFTKDEYEIVGKIVKRAIATNRDLDYLTLSMDIAATHAQYPLLLCSWLAVDDVNFFHDIGGIIRHMDRDTGKLLNCFVPRFAQPEGA